MRPPLAAAPLLLLALALPVSAPAAETEAASPPGEAVCRGVAQDGDALGACLREVSGPCFALRESQSDAAFAGCLAERALAWEAAATKWGLILRPTGHAEGKSGRQARWLAERSMRCRNPNQMAQMAAEVGEDATMGAVAQCELVASIVRVDQLKGVVEALEARK